MKKTTCTGELVGTARLIGGLAVVAALGIPLYAASIKVFDAIWGNTVTTRGAAMSEDQDSAATQADRP